MKGFLIAPSLGSEVDEAFEHLGFGDPKDPQMQEASNGDFGLDAAIWTAESTLTKVGVPTRKLTPLSRVDGLSER